MNPKASSKRFRKCIIHIGTEKTGTSAIQSHLRRHRRALLDHQILYPQAAGKHTHSQWEFVAVAQSAPWETDLGRNLGIVDKESRDEFEESFTEQLEQEFKQFAKAQTLLISSEHFHSRLQSTKPIEALKKTLSRWCETFEIIVYFRRQDQVAVSFQSTRLKSSVALKSVNLADVVQAHPRYFDFNRTYQNWSEVFGAENMNARLYDKKKWDSGNIVRDFERAANLPRLPVDSEFLNLSLNRQGFQFLQALNRIAPQQTGDISDPVRAALVQEISKHYAGKYYPCSQTEARDLMLQFAETNEQLRQRAFPNEPAPLFGDDFSEYPEIAEPMEENYDEGVEVALHLWRHSHKELDTLHPTFKALAKLVRRIGLRRL